MNKKQKKKTKKVVFTFTLPCDVTNPYDIINQVQFPLKEPDLEEITPFQYWFAEKYLLKEKG